MADRMAMSLTMIGIICGYIYMRRRWIEAREEKSQEDEQGTEEARNLGQKQESQLSQDNQDRLNKIEKAMYEYKWWRMEDLPEGIEWRQLEHLGVEFPPPYEPHNIPLLYDGSPVQLNPQEEEMASHFAAFPVDAPQLSNPEVAKIFIDNFFRQFKQLLGPNHVVQAFDKCDFALIRDHLAAKSKMQKETTPYATQKAKMAKEVLLKGFAIIDGHLKKVGNYKMQPPVIFRGRGAHPKAGCYRGRVMPEDVTINIGMEDPVPICPMPGHAWKAVVHRDDVAWLSCWEDSITDTMNYGMLSGISAFRGKIDRDKFQLARQLKKIIVKMREENSQDLASPDLFQRQRSTAVWLIDTLGLRTPDCTSLLVNQIHLNEIDGRVALTLASFEEVVRCEITLTGYASEGTHVLDNIKDFCTDRNANDQVFDKVDTEAINSYFKLYHAGLTAKTLRVHNTSIVYEEELSRNGKGVENYNLAMERTADLCHYSRVKELESKLETLKQHVADNIEKITEYSDAIKTMENEIIDEKTKRKEIFLTMQLNYIDPRITVSWCNRNDIPLSLVFNQSAIEKFTWAQDDVDSNWVF